MQYICTLPKAIFSHLTQSKFKCSKPFLSPTPARALMVSCSGIVLTTMFMSLAHSLKSRLPTNSFKSRVNWEALTLLASIDQSAIGISSPYSTCSWQSPSCKECSTRKIHLTWEKVRSNIRRLVFSHLFFRTNLDSLVMQESGQGLLPHLTG